MCVTTFITINNPMKYWVNMYKTNMTSNLDGKVRRVFLKIANYCDKLFNKTDIIKPQKCQPAARDTPKSVCVPDSGLAHQNKIKST